MPLVLKQDARSFYLPTDERRVLLVPIKAAKEENRMHSPVLQREGECKVSLVAKLQVFRLFCNNFIPMEAASTSQISPSIADYDLQLYLGTDQELEKILNSFIWADDQSSSPPASAGAVPSLQPLPPHLMSSGPAIPASSSSSAAPTSTSTPNSPFSSTSSDSETILHQQHKSPVTEDPISTPAAAGRSKPHPKRKTLQRRDIPPNVQLPIRKGGMHLWQFLYGMLLQPTDYSDLIEWTSNKESFEFRLLEPEAIAMWWGYHKNKTNMSYDKLSRSLRYYYDKCIIRKMAGERYVYRFCVDPELMYNALGNSENRPQLKPLPQSVKIMLLECQQQPKEPANCSRVIEEINPLLRHQPNYSSPEYSPISIDIPSFTYGGKHQPNNFTVPDFSQATSTFSPSIVAYGKQQQSYSSPEFSPTTSLPSTTNFSHTTNVPSVMAPSSYSQSIDQPSSFSPTIVSSSSIALSSPSYSPPLDHLVPSSYGVEPCEHDMIGKCISNSNQQPVASLGFPDISCCHTEPTDSFFPYNQQSSGVSSVHMQQVVSSASNVGYHQFPSGTCTSYCSPSNSSIGSLPSGLAHYQTKENSYESFFNLEGQFTMSTVGTSQVYREGGGNFSEYHPGPPMPHFSNPADVQSNMIVDFSVCSNNSSPMGQYSATNVPLIPN